MKKLNLLWLMAGILFQFSFGQNYVSFPTESAHWNCLFWHQWEPNSYILTNYQYLQEGDTILKGKTYKKLYEKQVDLQSTSVYIGGLREDSEKQIFFFASSTVIGTVGMHTFPNDTSEQLLYTFNNLSVGMVLPINPGQTTFQVLGIDSVLLGNEYRKRYEIQGSLMFGPEYWIEGIGSTKDLLAPFTFEFEWQYYTLCYEDINTYFINSPDGNDSCHYSVYTGITENERAQIKVYPNPANDFLSIETPFKGMTIDAIIYNIQGRPLLRNTFSAPKTKLDVKGLNPGFYYLQLKIGNDKIITRFIRE